MSPKDKKCKLIELIEWVSAFCKTLSHKQAGRQANRQSHKQTDRKADRLIEK